MSRARWKLEGDGPFRALLRGLKLPQPEAEYRFAPPRRWRFDYAWPDARVALEVEGGAFAGGRHTRGAGFRADCEKYSEAAARGWRVIRVLPEQLCAEQTFDWIRRALATTNETVASGESSQHIAYPGAGIRTHKEVRPAGGRVPTDRKPGD